MEEGDIWAIPVPSSQLYYRLLKKCPKKSPFKTSPTLVLMNRLLFCWILWEKKKKSIIKVTPSSRRVPPITLQKFNLVFQIQKDIYAMRI